MRWKVLYFLRSSLMNMICAELGSLLVSRNILDVHPWRLTWNIIMEVWKIIFLSKWVICRFHVNLPRCMRWFLLGLPTNKHRGCGWTPRYPTLLRFGSKNRGVTRQPASELLYLPPPTFSDCFCFFLEAGYRHMCRFQSSTVLQLPAFQYTPWTQ